MAAENPDTFIRGTEVTCSSIFYLVPSIY